MLQFYGYHWLFPNYEYKPFQVALFSTRCGDPWRLGQPSRPSLAFLNEWRKLHPSSPNHQCIICTTSHYQMIDTLNELTIIWTFSKCICGGTYVKQWTTERECGWKCLRTQVETKCIQNCPACTRASCTTCPDLASASIDSPSEPWHKYCSDAETVH